MLSMKNKVRMVSVLAILAMLLSFANVSPALAARPTTEVVVIENSSSVNTALCGFPITFTENGTFKVTTYYDSAGNPVKSILTNYNVRYTQTATANGKTLLTNFPAVYITSFPSGDFVQLGLRAAYTVPGVILLDAGRISFAPDGTVVFEAGQHQLFDGDLAAFCNYFAQ
jgi:hypothetical protein